MNRPTALLTDASRLNGLAYALLQEEPKEGTWRLVKCGSRFISETESRYAMVKLELLANTWAVNKARIYLLGLDQFTIVTNHRPLVSILNHQTHDQVDNARLRRMKLKLMPYSTTSLLSGKRERVTSSLTPCHGSPPPNQHEKKLVRQPKLQASLRPCCYKHTGRSALGSRTGAYHRRNTQCRGI